MKKITSIISVVVVLVSALVGCYKTPTSPRVSPHGPVVSESPSVPSPKASALPTTSPRASPIVSPKTSPKK